MSELHPSQRSSSGRSLSPAPEYVPDPFFLNGHLMTMMPLLLRRPFGAFAESAYQRLFTIERDVRLLGHCHFQANPKEHHTLMLLHGLEGCSESSYILGVARKAFHHGFNVVRLNMRNCGGSMHLSHTLYNAGQSDDVLRVAAELATRDGLDNIMLAGFSLGGNIVLKAAAENAISPKAPLRAVAAVSPSIDLERAVMAIERRENRLYQNWFLRTLKQKIIQKAKLYPHLYNPSALKKIDTIRAFDDCYTAPNGGYGSAANYYQKASAINMLEHINIPTLILASGDDPIVPFDSFNPDKLQNNHIDFIATKHGGHGVFIQRQPESFELFDQFWAENRVVGFCLNLVRSQ